MTAFDDDQWFIRPRRYTRRKARRLRIRANAERRKWKRYEIRNFTTATLVCTAPGWVGRFNIGEDPFEALVEAMAVPSRYLEPVNASPAYVRHYVEGA